MSAVTVEILRLMVRGAYDLQKLRMQCGLRLVANFRHKLREPESETSSDEELSDEALKLIDHLKASYKRLTDGVARNRTLPKEEGFEGDQLISTFSELVLIDQYIRLEQQEGVAFRQMTSVLEKIPIFKQYLASQRGIGPAMAAVLIGYLDIRKAKYPSSFWAYAGLDVGPDGRGRSRRAEHLVERTYTDREGREAKRMGITYEPFLKSKLMGVLGPSFLRTGSDWRKTYDDYRHRIETDPARKKVSITEWKKLRKDGEDMGQYWPPGRIHMAAIRFMVKMFLLELWRTWRELEGLPVADSYHEARRGRAHGVPEFLQPLTPLEDPALYAPVGTPNLVEFEDHAKGEEPPKKPKRASRGGKAA